MRLNEFMEYTVPSSKLRDVLYNNDDILINYISEPDAGYGVSNFYLDRNSLMQELDSMGMKLSGFDKIIHKYGWYVSFARGNKISILKYNGRDSGQYDVAGAYFKNLYIHISNIRPSKIINTGLKTKASRGNIDSEGDTSILYPEKRLYLWKLESASCNVMKTSVNFEKEICRTFKRILHGLDGDGYGLYVYLVKLPENIETHYDREYGEDIPARYILQDVPPSKVKYVGTVSDLEAAVLNNDSRTIEKMFGI